MDLVQSQAEGHLQAIENAIAGARASLSKEVKRLLKRYQARFGLGREDMGGYLEERISRAEAGASDGAYSPRMSRGESLRAHIAIEFAGIARTIEQETAAQLRFTAVEAFDRRMFAIQQQAGRLLACPEVGQVNVPLDAPWAG